ncbi:MAG TPA: DUF929 family protein [Ktedonobacteraceae bacterium]|jgi:hypothetical protein
MSETWRSGHPGAYPLGRRLLVLAGVLLMGAALIGGYVLATRLANRPNTNPLLRVVPADQTIVQEVTDVPPSIVQAVGTGDLPNPLTATRGQPFLQGPEGHPEFFFASAQFCQYCATERWAILNALGRFGRLTHIGQMQSYEENISTFSFDQSVYISQFLDFVPVEVLGNTLAADGQHFVPLQPLSAGQQQLFLTYSGPPYFQTAGNYPFLDLGNRYLIQASGFDPGLLQGLWRQFPLSWQQIARALKETASPITRAIIGSANYLTAALCTLTHQMPATTCQVPAIQQIERVIA